MNSIKALLAISILGLSSSHTFAADDSVGAFRLGIGQSQTIGFDENYDYTTLEVGYDYDRIFGLTADYSLADDDFIPDRATVGAEFGYEFGDEFRVKPYGSVGLVHMKGNGADGTTWGTVGVGLRASFKMFYINASYDFLPEADENNVADEEGTYWIWKDHESVTLTVGLKF